MPFFVAILLNEFRHAKGYLRILVYLPVMLPPASALFLFKYYAYDPSDAGLFNAILKALHLPTSQWMQSTTMTMPAMVIASTWMNMGGAVLIYLAALQNIPGELYEAAELDGAGIWRRIRHVTIPQTKLILSLMADAADRGHDAAVHRAADPGQRRRRAGLGAPRWRTSSTSTASSRTISTARRRSA